MYIVYKSEKCVQNEHGICEGITIETIDDSQITKMCECQCHDNMYKLAQRMQASNNQY
jgi:hypothetical protein